MYVSR